MNDLWFLHVLNRHSLRYCACIYVCISISKRILIAIVFVFVWMNNLWLIHILDGQTLAEMESPSYVWRNIKSSFQFSIIHDFHKSGGKKYSSFKVHHKYSTKYFLPIILFKFKPWLPGKSSVQPLSCTFTKKGPAMVWHFKDQYFQQWCGISKIIIFSNNATFQRSICLWYVSVM